jgi:hypothetical protein
VTKKPPECGNEKGAAYKEQGGTDSRVMERGLNCFEELVKSVFYRLDKICDGF